MSPRTVLEKIAYAEKLLQAAKDRQERFLASAGVAERENDDEGMLRNMSESVENRRFIERLERDIAQLRRSIRE